MYDHGGMNRFYRLVWSEAKQAYVPIPEMSNKRGKRKGGVFATLAAAAIALLSAATAALADPGPHTVNPVMHAAAPMISATQLPTGGQVVGGSGAISTSGTTATITQTSQNLAINWDSFSIGKDGKVIFNQPNASAIALNRVLGGDASQIYGQLQANGQVFLVNPDGVLFAKGSQVSAAGILASTRDISVADFMAGKYHLTGTSSAGVTNDGTLTAADGGYIVLTGAQVINDGTLLAQKGDIRLAAGDDVTVRLDNGGLLDLTIGKGAYDGLVSNGGIIKADGGRIYLTAEALDALSKASVNTTGLIEAETVDNIDGKIVLKGDMMSGTVNVAGTLDASAPNGGNGGSIETSAATAKIADSATLTTKAASGHNGSWLIDPTEFTIAATGGDMTGAALTTALGSGNVQIESSSGASGTSGDINVNDTVTWSANTLTLTAANNVNINAVMTMSGSASVDFEPATANGSASAVAGGIVNVGMDDSGNFLGKVNICSACSVTIGGQAYTVINSLGANESDTTSDTLQGMQGNLAGHYVLGSDIDASATSAWNSGQGFAALGAGGGSGFTGTFDGLGHTVSNLYFASTGWNPSGLFGMASGTSSAPVFIRNLALSNVTQNCLGGNQCAGLIGYAEYYTTLQNVSVSGTLSSDDLDYGGFIVGEMDSSNSYGPVYDSSIIHAFASGTMTLHEAYYVGGIAGIIDGGTVSDAHADVTMNLSPNYYYDGEDIGGLVGYAYPADIADSDAHAIINLVSGSPSNGYGEYEDVGGLVGYYYSTTTGITNSHATGSITSSCAATSCNNDDEYIGGLIGEGEGNVIGSYATTSLTLGKDNNYYVGGFAGGLYDGTISDSYATGAVSLPGSGNYEVGGFVGDGGDGYTIAVSNVYSTGMVSVGDNATYVGGLWGYATGGDTMTGIHATGNVEAGQNASNIGGLLGGAGNETISQAYATGDVTTGDGAYQVGGLIGGAGSLTLDTAFATGNVVAGSEAGITRSSHGSPVGGLIGEADGATLSNVYASGTVTGGTYSDSVGGLIGYMGGGTLTDSYSSGAVSTGANSTASVGGLIGLVDGSQTLTDTFWDTTASGQSTSAGASGSTGLTTTQMQTSGAFAAWNLASTWIVYDGNADPLLRAYMTPLTISVNPTKTYDGSATTNVLSYSAAPDQSQVFGTLVATGASKDVGVYSVTLSGLYSGQFGYAIDYTGGSLTVTPKSITVTGNGVDRTYNGLTSVGVNLSSTGVISGDDVTFSGTGAMSTKDAGNGKSVSITGIADGGNDAGNYTLANTTASGTVNIAKKSITVTGNGVDRTYNGLAGVDVSLSSTGVVNGDDVSFSGAGAMADKTAGNGKGVSITGITDGGNDAANYTLANTSASGTVNIAKKTITVTGNGVDRTYDATTAVDTSLSSAGVIGGDDVTFSGTGAMSTKNAGNGKSVSITGITDGGNDAANYILANTTASGTVDIAKASLDVEAIGINKTYDGTTSAGVSLISDGVASGDNVTFSDTSALMANKSAGNGKTVTVSGISLSGSDAGNYNLLDTATTTTVNIAKKALTVTGDGVDRTYDATTAVDVTLGSMGIVNGDDVTFSGIGTMSDKNAGSNKTVTVTGISLSGVDATNYNLLDTSTTTTANIAKANLMVDATGINRTYNGSTSVGVTLSSDSVVSGDTVTFADTSALMADKTAGTGKTVTVSGLSLGGSDATNYNLLDTSTTTTANIAKANLMVDATGINKTYDGSISVGVTLSSDGVVSGDTVTFADTSALMADKNAGTNKTVTVSGISLGGADAGNYAFLDASTTTTASIAKKSITVTGTGVDRTYDGTTSVGVSLASNGVVSGDTVTFSGTGAMADKTAGTGKSVAIAGITDGGADASNYALANTTASGTANIAKKTITVTGTGVDRAYDGTTSVGVSLASNGVVSGDTVTFSGTGTLADKNVGTGKTVAISGISDGGADASNYTLANTTGSTTADIARKSITVTGTGVERTYDGTTSVGVTTAATGVVSGDTVTFSGTGTLADKNAGTGKTVAETFSATGADAGNYSYNATGSTTATIDAKAIAVALTDPIVKTGDGSTNVSLTSANYAVSGLISGDSISVTQTTGAFADASAGTNKTVTAALSGSSYAAGANTSLGNYALYIGNVSANVGELDNPVTAPYQAALTSIPTMPSSSSVQTTVFSTIVGSSGPAASTGDGDNTVATNDKAGSVDGSIASMQTKDSLTFHRTFSIADGGIKLPNGVNDTDSSGNSSSGDQGSGNSGSGNSGSGNGTGQ